MPNIEVVVVAVDTGGARWRRVDFTDKEIHGPRSSSSKLLLLGREDTHSLEHSTTKAC